MARRKKKAFRSHYELTVYVEGYEDAAIKKAVGKRSEGSGTDLTTGLRDMDFEGFKTERAARSAAKRVKKAVRGTVCVLHSSKKI